MVFAKDMRSSEFSKPVPPVCYYCLRPLLLHCLCCVYYQTVSTARLSIANQINAGRLAWCLDLTGHAPFCGTYNNVCTRLHFPGQAWTRCVQAPNPLFMAGHILRRKDQQRHTGRRRVGRPLPALHPDVHLSRWQQRQQVQLSAHATSGLPAATETTG